MICLDDDVFRKYASESSHPEVTRYLAAHRNEQWLLPSIVLFEFLQHYSTHSTIRSSRTAAEENVDGILPLDGDVAEEAANIQARLATAGTSLDLADLLIAGTAREHGCTLATGNKQDFDKPPVHELLDVDIVQ
jgi:predicted nucleic acid-binding protein